MNLLKMLMGPISTVLERVVPDKNKREEMAHQIAQMVETHAHEAAKMQMEVNKQEASHTSIFVAGWRPAIGWICGGAMAWNFVLLPMVLWLAWLFPEYQDDIAKAPRLGMEEIMPVLLGMLGLGGMRSYEKRHGVSRETTAKSVKK